MRVLAHSEAVIPVHWGVWGRCWLVNGSASTINGSHSKASHVGCGPVFTISQRQNSIHDSLLPDSMTPPSQLWCVGLLPQERLPRETFVRVMCQPHDSHMTIAVSHMAVMCYPLKTAVCVSHMAVLC